MLKIMIDKIAFVQKSVGSNINIFDWRRSENLYT